ncbi:hypothetical protein HDU98_000301 [Podochytrium sp. JEL0797]|nr:hypothetical protein HDU98_000301 [Podochytrium sp. JEL0797]
MPPANHEHESFYAPASRDRRMRFLKVFALSILTFCILTVVILVAVQFTLVKSTWINSWPLVGCYDAAGNPTSLFASPSDPVPQNGTQCQALLGMAKEFGFPVSQCEQNTTFANPNDPTSFITAKFCDANTIYLVDVHKPPVSFATIPPAFAHLTNLWSLGMHNAVYGPSVLNQVLNALVPSVNIAILNMTGTLEFMNDSTRVLSGSIPAMPVTPSWQFVSHLYLANNNLSGTIPPLVADVIYFT